ncbi:unnamed protein product [Allacma fusca]|uniref:Mediator of RNA polymerase II transcription subunit 15 n=1 Tax=Allacma fusca TaxID=39272 RepID=A0A8J2NXT4_9HEXA|nr:unnamed protein product [Allacma fusca]
MVGKIEEAVIACGAPTTKNAMEMENQVFSKAKSRDEYMSFVARLIIHIKEMGSKKTGPGMTGQQNPAQVGNAGMGQMSGAQQNIGMMTQLNQMGGIGMMNQPGMVQMSSGPPMMQGGGLSQQQQHQHQMNSQPNPQTQMINQQNFIQQAQMQNVQMQNSQLQPGQMQNSQMGNVQLQNQQMMNSAQLQNSQLQNVQLQNAQLQNQQMHNQQIQNAQQIQNSQMQNQQIQSVQQMQNIQMQNAQLQDHMRSAQMNVVPMGNVQMQNSQMGNVQLPNSQLGNVQMGNSQMGNPQLGSPQMVNQQMGNAQMPGDNQMRSVQMQPGQQMHNVQMPGQIPNPNLQNMMNSQQSQQMMPTRTLGNRMGQAPMANQLSNLAKQQPAPRGMHRAPNVDSVVMSNQYSPAGPMMSRVTPSQFMPTQSGPGGMVQTPSPGPPGSQNPGYANSPAQSTLMPSPAAPVMSSGNMRPYQSQVGVPSPGPSLNTPLMNPATPSPRNPEDQACIEKIKELRKYTDLLQRMIAKIGNDDVEKSSKMKKLLEILTNPNQRVSMEILLKCEVALKKMERQQNDPGGMLGPTPQPPPMKDQSQVSPFQQVMDSLNTALRTPSSSHTLLRTFRPTVEALTGHSFISLFQPYEEEGSSDSESTENDVPPLLKRELRTLDSRFHVSVVRKGGGICRLSCNLNEPRLPRVPPLKISVRSDYPFEPPVVTDLNRDYSSTVFLSSVARAFKSRFHHLTRNHSVIELLLMWEMCVRQASNPNVKCEKPVHVNRGTVALGL